MNVLANSSNENSPWGGPCLTCSLSEWLPKAYLLSQCTVVSGEGTVSPVCLSPSGLYYGFMTQGSAWGTLPRRSSHYWLELRFVCLKLAVFEAEFWAPRVPWSTENSCNLRLAWFLRPQFHEMFTVFHVSRIAVMFEKLDGKTSWIWETWNWNSNHSPGKGNRMEEKK